MKQFIVGSDAAFAELKERATRACIKFRGMEMPPGCTPSRADIGIEVDPLTGVAKLMVDHGVQYTGANSELGDWFRSGTKDFASLPSW